MANLWKVTAKKEGGKIVLGMNVEIIKSGTTAKPNSKEISKAISDKYNAEVSESRCSEIYFNIEKI